MKEKMMNNLAFDLGASSGKIHVSDYDGKKLSLKGIHRFDNGAVETEGSLYWDFPMILEQYKEGILKALSEYPSLSSVGVDSFCNDFSLIGNQGELLIPVRSYRDPRTIRNEESIYARMSKEELYSISGNQIAPFNTLMQLAAMQIEGQGGLLKDARQLLLLPDLLAYFLTGECYTERTLASVTQMYDHGSRDWSDEVLGRFGIERRIFAPFIDAGSFAGETSAAAFDGGDIWQALRGGAVPGRDDIHTSKIFSLPKGLRVCAVPGHDTATAFMAAQADENTLVISGGTWMLVGCETKNPVISDFGFRHNIANEGGIDGRHRLIRNLMGFWILQEVHREFDSENVEWDFDSIKEAAEKLPSFKWLFDVDLPEFYSPGDMRRKISNLCMKTYGSAPETPAEFTASVCESLAFKARWAMEKLEKLAGRRFECVNIIGGASKNGFLAQIIADVTGLPALCGPSDASALVNIMFQLMAFGELADVSEGRNLIRESVPLTHYEPKAVSQAGEAYERFIKTFSL